MKRFVLSTRQLLDRKVAFLFSGPKTDKSRVRLFYLGMILLILTAMILIMGGFRLTALADNDSSVSVSCSIPAVPGLNAPPVDREK